MPTVDLPRRQLLLKQEPPSRVRHRRTRTICHDCFPVVTRHMRRRGFLEAWIESLGRLLSEESQRNSRPTLTHEKTQGPQQKNTQRHNRETAQGFQEMHPAPRHTHREFYIPARSGPHSTRSHKPGLHRPLHQQISSQSSRRVLPLVQCRRATNTTTQPHTPNCKDSHHRRAWCSGTPPPRQRHPPTTHRHHAQSTNRRPMSSEDVRILFGRAWSGKATASNPGKLCSSFWRHTHCRVL